MQGQMPGGANEACLAAYLLVEHGLWPYPVTFFQLPQALGFSIVRLLGKMTSSRSRLLTQVLQQLEMQG